MDAIYETLTNSLYFAANLLIATPVRILYLRGPSLSGFGFWEGKESEGICSQLSNVPASFWADHRTECETLIERKLDSIVVATSVSLYVGVVMVVGLYFGAWLFIVRPVTSEIRRMWTKK